MARQAKPKPETGANLRFTVNFAVLPDAAFRRVPFAAGSESPNSLARAEPSRAAMETNLVQQLTATFEGHAQQTETGTEYWLARDLQQLLGYAEWRNFHQTAISKAKTACEVSGHRTGDHFVDVNKMVSIGSGTQREIDDINGGGKTGLGSR